MRELSLAGLVCLAFGLGAYRGTGELGFFGGLNIVLACVCLGAAAVMAVRRFGEQRARADRGPVIEAALMGVALLWAAVLVERAAAVADVRFDWTFEGRYELAPATREAVASLPCTLGVTLFHDQYDPRTRRTRLLLEELARHGDVGVRTLTLEEAPEEEDFFGVASSNTVVFECGSRWQRADRPTEGAMFEALAFLGTTDQQVVYVTTGAGEGDVESTEDLGYSGLSTALETEGYAVRKLDGPAVSEIPDDAAAVLVIAPERRLPAGALAAVEQYLERGGSLVALLEPGRQSGIEAVLARWGLASPDAFVVDPGSGRVDGDAPGLNPIASRYASHPLTEGLEANRRTFFRGARSFSLRKPQPEDRVRAVVFAGGDSWLYEDASGFRSRTAPERPADARIDYHPLVVAGSYPRDQAEARIVGFGDSDFAANRNLRALYNLDLALNAIHWATRRDTSITLRPKAGQLIQFPVPIQSSLRAFYGVGLVVPQALLLAGGLIWLRRRSA